MFNFGQDLKLKRACKVRITANGDHEVAKGTDHNSHVTVFLNQARALGFLKLFYEKCVCVCMHVISKMPIEIAKLIKFTDFTNLSGIPHFRTTFKGLKTH